MAIKDMIFGMYIRAYDQASGVLGGITKQIESMEGATKLAFGMGLDQLGEKLGGAGEKMLGFLETSFDVAAETQSTIASLSAAVPQWGQGQLDAAQEAADKFSSSHVGSVDAFIASMEALAPVFKTEEASAGAAAKALELHTTVGLANAQAVQLLTQVHENFQNSAAATAGQIAATKQLFGLPNVEGMSSAIGRLSGAAKAAGSDSAETFAITARMQQLLGEGSGRAAMAFSEGVTHASKFGLDSTKGLVNMLDQVRVKLGMMTHTGQIDFMSKLFGASAGMRLLPLIEGTGELRDKIAQIRALAPTALDTMLGKSESTGLSKIQIFHQRMQLLEESLGTKLLPIVTKVVDKLGAFIDRIDAFSKANPGLTKFLVIMAGVGAVALIAAGYILPIVASMVMLGAGALAAAGWILLIGGALTAATAAIIAWWPQIKSFFTTTIPKAYEWGVNLLKTFASGIESAALWPIHALEGVLKKMRAYLPFSPAKEGPLRDLHRVRIIETIAESMRPAALGAAMSRVGMAAMVAAPLMFGGGAGVANAGTGGPAPIVINYAPVINGATSPDEWVRAARKHADELVHILDARYSRRDRRAF